MSIALIRDAINQTTGSSVSRATSAVRKGLSNIPIAGIEGLGMGTGRAVLGSALMAGALSSSESPNPTNFALGAGAALAVGGGMALSAGRGISWASTKFGTNFGYSVPKRWPMKQVLPRYAEGTLLNSGRSLKSFGSSKIVMPRATGPSDASSITLSRGRWDPRMVSAMSTGYKFGRQLESSGGRQMLFGSGAMLTGALFNSAYTSGNKTNHAYNSQNGNSLR